MKPSVDGTKGAGIRFGIRWDGGRRPRGGLAATAALAAALAIPAAASAEPAPQVPAPVDVVVVAESGRVDAAVRVTERVGGAVGHRLGILPGFTASVPSSAVARLKVSGPVKTLSRDAAMHVSSTSGSDTANESALSIKQAIGSGESAFDGAGVDVAVLDSGVVPVGNLAQPGTVFRGPDFSLEQRVSALAGLDTFGHGTHVAGVIAGHDPLTGYEGVAPGARVVSIKVAGADGATSLSQVLLAIDWLWRNQASRGLDIRVLNISLGVDEPEGYRHEPLAWAVERIWDLGIVVVAAAGNNGAEARGLDLPAADPYVIAVGATDGHGTADPADDTVADYSSRAEGRTPDVVAPGSGVVSLRVPGSTLDQEFPAARVGDGFFRGSGTSQAAAVVSGLVARLISQRRELSPDEVKALLMAGAVDMEEPASADGAGRVDLGRSLELPTPAAADVKQSWAPAVLHIEQLFGPDARRRVGSNVDTETEDADGVDEVEAGSAEWAGRRWSGRRWSGMKWSGMKWSGAGWAAAG